MLDLAADRVDLVGDVTSETVRNKIRATSFLRKKVPAFTTDTVIRNTKDVLKAG